MTNIVTVSNGTFFTSHSAKTLAGMIARGVTWIDLHPTGTLLNLAHVVSIEDDGSGGDAAERLADDQTRLELPEVPDGPAQGVSWPC